MKEHGACDSSSCDSDPCDGKCWVDEELVELFTEFNRIPDAFKIESTEDGLHVTVYEVEVTHHLTDDKVADYAHLWGCVDASDDVHLDIVLVNRHGALVPFDVFTAGCELLQPRVAA